MVTLIFCRDELNLHYGPLKDIPAPTHHHGLQLASYGLVSVRRPQLGDYVNVQKVVKEEHAT